jgi:TFIIF-interacting CTD phosphatase-like protein
MDAIYQLLHRLWKPQKTIKGKHKRKKKKKDSTAALALKQLLSAPKKKKLLVLDLDETLVHSTSKGSRHHDKNCTLIEVLIEKHSCLYYVYKRPYVDYFLKKVIFKYLQIRFQNGIK